MNDAKSKIVIITGPTACGKTAVSVEVAKVLGAQIISADSMQIYDRLNIGAAKPTADEMLGIKHHLIGEIPINTPDFSAAEYKRLASERIDNLSNNGILPIVVGGTGLYINALTYPMQFLPPPADMEIRRKLEQSAECGNDVLHKKLSEVDPATAARLHPNDEKRIIRALEVYELSGKPFSSFETLQDEAEEPYNALIFALNMPREKLYQRIDMRVDAMLKAGLIDEANAIYNDTTDFSVPALQAIGYKELFAYFRGEYTLSEAVEIIKRESRRYAKRQLTWFRRDKRINWLDMTEYGSVDNAAAHIVKAVKIFLNGDGCNE